MGKKRAPTESILKSVYQNDTVDCLETHILWLKLQLEVNDAPNLFCKRLIIQQTFFKKSKH